MIVNILIRFAAILLRGMGMTLFGYGAVMFIYFCFFSEIDNRYINVGISAVCFLLSFVIYYLGDKLSHHLFWRRRQ